MKHSFRLLLVLSFAFFLTAGVASADSLLSYQITGPVSASFELPVNPTVSAFDIGVAFKVTPIDLMINGVASSDYLLFYNAALGGAFAAFSCSSCADLNLAGPQFYTGSEDKPTMLPLDGVTLTDFDTGAPVGVISTPEPSTLGLMSLGIVALGLTAAGFKRRLAFVAN